MPHRILIVEDHPVMQEGYASLIDAEATLEVCGIASDGETAFDLIPSMEPDLVLLDLALPGVHGIELLKRLRAIDTACRVLVVSAHDEKIYADRVIQAGANGYLSKHAVSDEVINAIRQVLDGQLYLSDVVRDKLVRRYLQFGHESSTVVDVLTDRELEVFELLGAGYTTREAADRMGLSPKTVESYRENIKRKLGLADAQELLQRAALWVASPFR